MSGRRRSAVASTDDLLASERRARLEAEAAHERLAFLASASAALNTTLDARSTAVNLGRLLVPAFCDWCVVEAVDDAGVLHELAVAHAAPDGLALLQECARRAGPAAAVPVGDVRGVLEAGSPVFLSGVRDTDLVDAAVDEDHLDLLRRLAPRSAIVAPLVARGRALGALTAVRTAAMRPFDADDLALVENVAARAGMAIDNARLFEERSRVARVLQQALLPPSLPEIPGMEVSARYQTAEAGSDIGGDFYDVFELPDGSWWVVVGDVSGKGTVAAAVTGLVRHTLRAVAVGEKRPSDVLRRTNDVLLGQVDETRFCTAALARLLPRHSDEQSVVASVSSGGHPRPYIVRADGAVAPIDCAGTLLGALPELDLVDVEIELGPGDAIVFYTDGVTEARRGRELFGEQGIAAALAGCDQQPASHIADRLTTAVWEYQDGRLADDTAVVVLRAAPR